MRSRPLKFLFLGIVSLICLILLVYFVSPSANLLQNTQVAFLGQGKTIILFFLLIAVFLFSTGTYILKSKAHGILIAGFAVSSLLFLLTNLNNPFFFIMLAALFLTLELFVSYRK